MTISNEINQRLAVRIREERKAKGLSLEALAKLSGVSKSMLSQIERGGSSPTVASMWNIARALNLDLGDLLEDNAQTEDNNFFEILREGQIPVITGTGEGCLIRILSEPKDVGISEVYELRFEAGGTLKSDSHRSGCVEHLMILDGSVEVTSGDKTIELEAGDTARYRADLPHSIQAKSPTRSILIVKGA
ncbi:MAG: XRE family transcriptional regulator [Alphaproteobacteria bacterium]|nr:XRE family transcriptional regulator [Alphaproteobacteria bacterium]